MKNKKVLWGLAALAGAAGAAYVATRVTQEKQVNEEREEAVAQIRAHFESFGPVATLYVLLHESDADHLRGGVVMESGTSYRFELSEGQLSYQEESL